MNQLTSIITHNDFDGLGSAAILSWAFDIDDIRFAGPITIARAEIPITLSDVVSDLPYPLECGMWFDHHAGNLKEVELRGIDPASIPGRFAEAPSCVRVVFDYFAEQEELPADYADLADAADLIDSFAFPDIESWRADTSANRIDRAMKASGGNKREQFEFLRELVYLLRDLPLAEIAENEIVKTRAAQYAREEERMLDYICKYGRVLPEDEHAELYFVDLTSFRQPARIDKKLIGLVHPKSLGYVELKPVFRDGRKTQDVAVSLSLSLQMQRREHSKDMGEIVRVFNIGDGHAGAAAGVWRCDSAHEYQTIRENLPAKILELWRTQS